MVKKKITKSVKKQVKNKNKNININIHIDQSKRTTGSNPRKSNIKTLPAYSAAPSSGGNYVRQFVQDPYYPQSQNEYDQLLLKYNNLVKKNNPATRVLDSEKNKNRNYPKITNDFKDKNQNDQQLITPEQALVNRMNDSTINREYRVDDESTFLDKDEESIQGRLIDFEMNDDPRTNAEPENMLVRKQNFQQLPYNDLNTKDELIEYDKTPNLLKIEDGKLTTSQEDLKSESKSLFSRRTPPTSPHPDEIYNAMISKDIYYKGSKIIRSNDKELAAGKYFNKTTGLFVLPTNEDYLNSVKAGTSHLYYSNNAYNINKVIQSMNEGEFGYNQNWARYKEVKKKVVRKPKMIVEEKEDSDNDPDEIFINANKGTGNALSALVQSAAPPPPQPAPIEIKIKTRSKAKEDDDNKSTTSMLSRVSAIFTPKQANEPETIEQKPVKFKPKALEPKVKKVNKSKSVTNKVGIA